MSGDRLSVPPIDPPASVPSSHPATPNSITEPSDSAASAPPVVPRLDTTQKRDVIPCKECEGSGNVSELLQRWNYMGVPMIERTEYACSGCKGRGFNNACFGRSCETRWTNTFGTTSWRWSRKDYDRKPRLSYRWRDGIDGPDSPPASAQQRTFPPPAYPKRQATSVAETLISLDEVRMVPAGIEVPPHGRPGVLLVRPNPNLDRRVVRLRSLNERPPPRTAGGSPGWWPIMRPFPPPSLPARSKLRDHGLRHHGCSRDSSLVHEAQFSTLAEPMAYCKSVEADHHKPTSAQIVARDPWFRGVGPRGVAGFHKTISHLNVRNP